MSPFSINREFYFFLSCQILHNFLSSSELFQNKLFSKYSIRIPPECQTIRILTMIGIFSSLIWVQTVLQRLSADETSRQRVKGTLLY